MAYIKQKKEWKKLFSQEELDSTWDFFKSLISTGENRIINWEEEDYRNFVLSRNRFYAHPETYKWDDTVGIQPKQWKEFLSFGINEDIMKEFFLIVSRDTNILHKRGEDNYYLYLDTEEIWNNLYSFSWKKYFKKEVLKDKEYVAKYVLEFFFGKDASNDKDLIELCFKEDLNTLIFHSLKTILNNFPYKVSTAVIKRVLKEEISLNDLNEIKELKPYPSNTLISLKNYSLEKYFEELRTEWKKVHGFEPKDNLIFLIDIDTFDKKSFLQSLNQFFKVKQFGKLSLTDKKHFVHTYALFGKVLPQIGHLFKKENVWITKSYSDLKNLDIFQKIIQESRKGIDPLFKAYDLIKIRLGVSILNEDFKRDRFSFVDIETFKMIGDKILNNQIDMETFQSIPYNDWYILSKVQISNRDLGVLLDLYQRTKNLEVKNIPVLNGSIGDYRYEVLTKKDFRGLLLGNITQCCQRIGGMGQSCVYYGAENEDSTFFVVYKGDTIVAQSWIWFQEGKGLKQITFDSIEAVSNAYKDGVIACYEDYAEKAIEAGIDLVTCGSYGRTGSNKFSTISEENRLAPPNGVYTDARGQYLIKRK